MPASRRPGRTTLSARVRRDLLERMRVFVRDHAGKPLYLDTASFVEGAIEAHLEACERKIMDEAAPTTRSSNRFLNPNGRR
jgi:hypothetical protein